MQLCIKKRIFFAVTNFLYVFVSHFFKSSAFDHTFLLALRSKSSDLKPENECGFFDLEIIDGFNFSVPKDFIQSRIVITLNKHNVRIKEFALYLIIE